MEVVKRENRNWILIADRGRIEVKNNLNVATVNEKVFQFWTTGLWIM
jgi:hypothetical protein